MTECQISDWCADLIQRGYHDRLKEVASAKEAVTKAEEAVLRARAVVSNLEDAVRLIAKDAEKLGVALS